ncbi:hypothetical protein GJW-30_1_03690 [Variibacter gotjawalensis]|uniref:DUF2783 domain-containing protein n=1 Tax=Variibacter gotjawalensis TaxID=1333996 RepID=A0A0S3PZ07_9BRAD|nr:DUF2783 domain-containing protein [Variibacter gotjawalensis]NIK46971.1 hypothetical protein [Variibacter gotjawalensis]RZS48875.1 uncharacterized protein DUF2783 [Variibacter gotjawalensis]BAT61134.1 hypothetical protein GJW-30_1_03690 [Variibacter gotjawalensis]
MSELITASRLPDPDIAYRMLVDAHRDLTAEESGGLNARLVLILANHIGNIDVLSQAIALAKQGK